MNTILALSWFDAENFLLISGLVLVLVSILSVVKTPWLEVQLLTWQRLVAGSLGLILFSFWIYLFIPAKVIVVEPSIPLGGIIAWWGDWSDLKSRPIGYEICDGNKVTTPNSRLNGMEKPDLTGKFLRGAEKAHWSLITSSQVGGTDEIKGISTLGVALTIDQMPSHNHSGSTATDGEHSHSTSGSSASDDGGSGGDSHFALGDANEVRNWPGIKILPSKSAHSHAIPNEGSGKEHDHKIPTFDNRPSYTEAIYLIRVI